MKKWYQDDKGNVSAGRIFSLLLILIGLLIIIFGLFALLKSFKPPIYDEILKLCSNFGDDILFTNYMEILKLYYLNKIRGDTIINIIALGVALCATGAGAKVGQSIFFEKGRRENEK